MKIFDSYNYEGFPKPGKTYNCVVADPPWSYSNNAVLGAASKQYETQELDWILNLPVSSIVTDDALLFLWITHPLLANAFKVFDRWGFKYTTCAFVWVKETKNKKDFFGCGSWTRANSELLLLGRRGNPVRKSASVRQVIRSKMIGHSRKPAAVFDRIEDLFQVDKGIELFSRSTPHNSKWDVFGNQVGMFGGEYEKV